MGTTRAFSNLRLVVHLLVLIILICNVVLIIAFVLEHKFFQVEEMLRLGIFDLQCSFKYTIVIHIIMALFGACTINSKNKWYVRLYLLFGFLGLCILVAFFCFLTGFYKSYFDKQFGMQMAQNASVRSLARAIFDCSDYGGNDCITIMKERIDFLIKYYTIIAAICFVCTLLIYILGRIMLGIEVSVPAKKEKPPTMQDKVSMGYDSGSLRTRRIVDPDLRYTGSVLNTNK